MEAISSMVDALAAEPRGNLRKLLLLLICLLLLALLEPASVATAADALGLGTAAPIAAATGAIPATTGPAAIGPAAIGRQRPADVGLSEAVMGDQKPSPPEASVQGSLLALWTHHRIGMIALPIATIGIALLLFRLSLRNRQLSAAHRAAVESERRFRATFDQAAIGMAHLTPNGRWLRVNRRFCGIVGYSQEELQARSFTDITHPDNIKAHSALRQRCLTGEIDSFQIEQRMLRKDGSPLWVDSSVALVRGDNGDPDYFIAVMPNNAAATWSAAGSGRSFRGLRPSDC